MQEQDVPRYAEMMRDHWMESLRQEGTIEVDRTTRRDGAEPDGEPPCPACGTAAPLVDGCCVDCGLHLA